MADRMKEKLENILYYHKAKILAGVAAAALLLYAAAVLGGGSADTALYGESVNVRLSSEEIEQVCEAGSHALGLDAGKEQILLETGMEIDVKNPDNNAMSGNLEKMTTAIFAHEIDFMVCTPEVMDYYAGKDSLEKIDTLAGAGSDELEERFEESADSSGQRAVYGVNLSGTALEGAEKDAVFCIFRNSERKSDTVDFLESIVQKK